MLKITLFILLTAGSLPRSMEEGGWHDLILGADLEGWRSSGVSKSHWCVRNGVLSGKWRWWNLFFAGGWIWSETEYEDFDLSLEYRINRGGNSGVAVRWPRSSKNRPSKSGYEIQILDRVEADNPSGSIYNLARADGRLNRPGEWNRLFIRCRGECISVWLNGIKAAEITDDRSRKGRIGFQVHDPFSRPQFRGMKIRCAPDNCPPQEEYRRIPPR